MSVTRPRPERIDLAKADDPRDVVHQAVACLAQGECIALENDRAVGLFASAMSPSAVNRVCESGTKGSGQSQAILLLRSADELADWVPVLSHTGSRLARRAWPGLVTLVFPTPNEKGLFLRLNPEVRRHFEGPNELAVRVPEHPFLRDVLKLLPGPVVFRLIDRVGPEPVREPEAIASDADCRLVIQAEPGATDGRPTFVRISPEGWELLREGSVSESAVQRMAGTIILFVCTGNTCRSPMAEAICKVLMAERLDCKVGELEAKGFVVLSAGIAAATGMPAASHAMDVVKARGGSLRDHASRKLAADLVGQADLILTMTGDHLEALVDAMPEAATRSRPLHPEGEDVADPVGADRETYRRTAEAIESYLVRLLYEIGL